MVESQEVTVESGINRFYSIESSQTELVNLGGYFQDQPEILGTASASDRLQISDTDLSTNKFTQYNLNVYVRDIAVACNSLDLFKSINHHSNLMWCSYVI